MPPCGGRNFPVNAVKLLVYCRHERKFTIRKVKNVTTKNVTTKKVGSASGGGESSVKAHRFQVGQTVSFSSNGTSRPAADGAFQVIRLLPSDGDDYQYRIKHPGEAFERVAKESQLDRAN